MVSPDHIELLPDDPPPEHPVDEESDAGARVTDRFHAGALRVMEDGPYAPQCPQGHGRLIPAVDPSVATGVSLSCPTCGFQRGLAVNLLRNSVNRAPSNSPRHAAKTPSEPSEQPTARLTTSSPRHAAANATPTPLWRTQAPVRDAPADDIAQDNAIPDPPRRRGTKPDGTVRTCGGVRIRGWVTPAGLWSPVVGLLVGLVLTGGQVWWSLLPAAAGYGLWWSATRWLWPCAAAVNRRRVHAEHLRPGTWIRLHGRFGPVARVDNVTAPRLGARTEGEAWVRVGFAGGTFVDLPGQAPCTVVDLLG